MYIMNKISNIRKSVVKVFSLPFFLFFFSIYPAAFMYAHNVIELEIWMLLRPVIVSCLVAGLSFGLSVLIFRSIPQASLFSLVFLLLFFSYGHILQTKDYIENFLINILRHRFLIFLSLITLVIAGWLIRKVKVKGIIFPLNIIALAIFIFPIGKIFSYEMRKAYEEIRTIDVSSSDIPIITPTVDSDSPDIYYIILDSYTRSDVLMNRFDFDNSSFLDSLRKEGFFVAECSRSNYAQTLLSLNSSLNSSNINNIRPQASSLLELSHLLNNNIIYQSLRQKGYKLITFETGFSAGNITNSDQYMSPDKETKLSKFVDGFQAFETMFYNSTGLKLILDYQKILPQWAQDFINSPYSDVRENILFQLDKVTDLPPTPSPRIIHIHILAPHPPAKFDSEGRPANITKFFSLNPDQPSRKKYNHTMYLEEVIYLNKRVLQIVRDIKQTATRPVVIILQGDHGTFDFGLGNKYDRIKILNAYYFSDGDYSLLYKSITPINTFRVIFNKYFKATLPFMPDLTYFSTYDARFDFEELTDDNPACFP